MRRRRLLNRALIIGILVLAFFYLQSRLKPPEDVITKLCHEDQRHFLQELNVSLRCDCGQFHFKPSSQLDSFINVFSSIGERHKTILYLTLKADNQRVVLKYRKDTARLRIKASGEFNGRPYFCSQSPSNGQAIDSFAALVDKGQDNLLVANMNFEVILLKFLRSSGLPVPRYIGNCGLYLMEGYGGYAMDVYYKSGLKERLTIAKNIIKGGLALTEGYEGYRIYLTDATRDNIAVDEDSLAVTFIDLDDVIIQQANLFGSLKSVHRHSRIECANCFAYSTQAVCGAPLSDINIFSICQVGEG